MNFTDKYLQGLQPKQVKYTITESTGERGESRLQVNVYPTGIKKFQIQYYLDKKRRRYEFGKFGKAPGDLSLRHARIEFADLAGLVKDGIDPKNPNPQSELETFATLGHLHQNFLAWYQNNRKLNSYNTIDGFLKTSFVDQFDMNMPANKFTSDHGRQIIYDVWNRGSQGAADGLKSALSTMFKFGIDYDNGPERFGKQPVYNIKSNPIRDITLVYSKTPGQRWLDADEIHHIWHAKDMHPRLQRYIKLNIALAGQRISEVLQANISEFNLKDNLFEIPKERVKIVSRGDHLVPLSNLAKEVLQECAHHRGPTGLLFTKARNNTQALPIRSTTQSMNSWLRTNKDFKKFVLRDIRRTCKSHMSKAGINRDYRDMLQQHYKQDVATIHYDRYDYLQEKRTAIGEWEKYLLEIIHSL